MGVFAGSLFHSLASCHPLVGASGGIYALVGAVIIKFKRYKKYHGFRKFLHIILSASMMLFAIFDTTYTFWKWSNCDTNVSVFAHMGGLLSGKITTRQQNINFATCFHVFFCNNFFKAMPIKFANVF
jgi:membrane associated rhomboid family serine protease